MQFGDRNTTFFHAACMEQMRSNRVEKIRKDNGGWAKEEGEKKNLITNYFFELLKSFGD